jgi:hypothetical protein
MGPKWRAIARILLTPTLALSLAACSRKNEEASEQAVSPEQAQEEQLTPEKLRYVQAAEPFVHAIAGQKYEQAYDSLSSHAKARMTLNQFVAPPDALTFQRNEQSPFLNVTAANFVELMKKVEDLYGVPQLVESLAVFSTDLDVLARRNLEGAGIVESASAIGGMPEAIAADIRRASVHGEIATALTPGQLRQAATESDMKPEDLQKDPNFNPSFNVKIVLVEEDGQLKVGYFEFLPALRWN